MLDEEILKEFLIESTENLERLDQDMVALESHPHNAELLASIFRTVHTIKGTCGFLNFSTVEKITHHAENILDELRTGSRKLTPQLTSLILDTVDVIRGELKSIEATSRETGESYTDLIRRQTTAICKEAEPTAPSPSVPEALIAPEPASSVDASSHSTVADSTIRVDVSLLNRLMNLVGELVLVRNQILQLDTGRRDPMISATSQKLNLITSELQEGVMKTRMQPIGTVWGKFPRVVRDLAKACSKDISLELEGEATELDKTILEAIKDPLTHIVRNACDHGIEVPAARLAAGKTPHGTLKLRAYHEGGNVLIEISDDGAGINCGKVRETAVLKGLLRASDSRVSDKEILNFIFLPGFSTAREISNISGRGVGMDVVRTHIERTGGHVDVSTQPGQGTCVKIRIPLTLAIIPGLVVTASRERFVIPQANLLELVRLEGAASLNLIDCINGTPLFQQRGKLLPLACLSELLGMGPSSWSSREVVSIAILQAEDRRFGLIVDDISDTQEIVVKPLGSQLNGLSCYAGATIMGDGRVALILDIPGIARAARVLGDSHEAPFSDDSMQAVAEKTLECQKLLLFQVGKFERVALPLSLVTRLEDLPLSRIERAAGRMAVQYRGGILPLLRVTDHLEGRPTPTGLADPVSVVVVADGEYSVGLIVDRIIDIVEDVVAVTEPSHVAGILGSAVISGKVTDFIDISALIQNFNPYWLERKASRSRGRNVLLAENSTFSRRLLKVYLEIAGHRVMEASGRQEALAKIEAGPVDIVFTSLDLPGDGASELLRAIRRIPAQQSLPVVALGAQVNATRSGDDGADFSAYLSKSDRVAMLHSLERLSANLEHSGVSAA